MKLNVNSIRQRLQKLEQYVSELKRQQSTKLPKFKDDFTQQLAVERAFQAAVEACTDIAAHIVAVDQLGQPQESRDVYILLKQAGYLDPTLAEAMTAMVSFRNRLVHIYWDIEVEKLHHYLLTDVILLEQFRDFVLQILASEEGN